MFTSPVFVVCLRWCQHSTKPVLRPLRWKSSHSPRWRSGRGLRWFVCRLSWKNKNLRQNFEPCLEWHISIVSLCFRLEIVKCGQCAYVILQSHSCHSFNPLVKTTAFDTSSSTHLAMHTRYISPVSVLSLCQTWGHPVGETLSSFSSLPLPFTLYFILSFFTRI